MCNTCGCKSAETFEAYDDSISERQEWLIGELGGKVDKSMNRSKASDYIKKLKGKESGTWKDAESFEANEWFEENRPLFKESKRRIKTSPYDYNPVCSTCGGRMFAIGPYEMRDRSRIGNKQNDFFVMGCRNDGCSNYGYGAEGESKRKGSHTPKMQLITYEDVLREKMKNQNMKDAETFEADYSLYDRKTKQKVGVKSGYHDYKDAYDDWEEEIVKKYPNRVSENEWIVIDTHNAETFEANEEAVEQTDANMVNEGSVEAFYGGGAKVSVSSAGIQPTANPSVDEAFDVGNQVGLDVAEQEIMNRNPSVEVNYGAESGQMCEVCFGNDDLPYDSDHFTECRRCGKSVCMDCDGEMQSHPDWFKVCGECSDVLDNVHDYGGEDDDDYYDHNCMNCGEGIENMNWALKMGYEWLCYDCQHKYTDDELDEALKSYESENMSLKESAKLGFGVGAGLLGFNVALLGIATIGGFLLNRD